MKKIAMLLTLVMLASMISIPSFGLADEAVQVEIEAKAKNIIEVDGLQFKDLNGNGELDIYEDWRADVEDRITDLIGQMTIEEKVGELFHNFSGGTFSPIYPTTDEWLYSQEPNVEIDGITYVPLWYDITVNHITHFAYSASGTPMEQLETLNGMQEIGEATRLGIPISISTDRPYNTFGSMVNMPYYAFGTAHDPELLYDLVAQYSKEMKAMGYTTIFHGYGVEIGSWYGDEVNNIQDMATTEIKAYEENGVHSMTKHFIARGGRNSFASARSDAQLWENWMSNWDAAINEGGCSAIMMNNGTGLTNTPILYDSETLGYLRNELGFDGVLCTDWPLYMGTPSATGFTNDGLDLSKMDAGDLYTRMLECGIDQLGNFVILEGTDTNVESAEMDFATGMLPLYGWPEIFIERVNDGSLSIDTIDRSVRRILRNKFKLGLFEDPYRSEQDLMDLFASDAYKADQFALNTNEDVIRARNDYMNELDERIQTESAVLLKNDNNILPLAEGVNVYLDSNSATVLEKDTPAIGAYANLVETMDEADVVIAHVTSLDDAYDLIVEDANDADKPLVLVVEASNTANEPGAYEVENCAAILMQVYDSTPDHGTSLGDFYHYTMPNITADMLFGVREPSGSLVYEIARSAEDKAMSWGDLQLDMGVDDTTRLYLAAMIRNQPDVLIPNNLGDVLFTTNYGLRYGEEPDFDLSTLLAPKEVREVEQQGRSGMEIVQMAADKVQAADVPFEIAFIAQNNGADGYFNAEVYDGEKLIASKFMALDAGQFRVVTIELSLEAGTHDITVGGLTRTIEVE